MKSSNKPPDCFDWTLAFILLLVCIISIFTIASAQTSGQYPINFVPLQIRWYFVGAAIIAIAMYFESEQYKKMAWYLYGLGVFLLVFLFFCPGRRWTNC